MCCLTNTILLSTLSAQIDPKVQLKNISSIKVYNYGFDNKYSDMMGMAPDAQRDTGVLAQELREVLPDAVKETGDLVYPDGEVVDNLQVVNKVRSFLWGKGVDIFLNVIC